MLRLARSPLTLALAAAMLALLAGPPAASAQRAQRPGKAVKRPGFKARVAPRGTTSPRSQRLRRSGAGLRGPRTSALGEPGSTRHAGGPLKSGTYRVTRDQSHAHLSGPLQARGNDTVFTVKGNTVTFGPGNGVISGMSVELKPEVKYLKDKAETVGWTGTAERYNPNNLTTDTVTIRISGHPYGSFHPGLRTVNVEHTGKTGFRQLYSNRMAGAGWRTSSAAE